jgi:uncharacterized Zn finger protein (UPF0148 family)
MSVKCKWTSNGSDKGGLTVWQSRCKHDARTRETSLQATGYVFCPFCGRQITTNEFNPEDTMPDHKTSADAFSEVH